MNHSGHSINHPGNPLDEWIIGLRAASDADLESLRHWDAEQALAKTGNSLRCQIWRLREDKERLYPPLEATAELLVELHARLRALPFESFFWNLLLHAARVAVPYVVATDLVDRNIEIDSVARTTGSKELRQRVSRVSDSIACNEALNLYRDKAVNAQELESFLRERPQFLDYMIECLAHAPLSNEDKVKLVDRLLSVPKYDKLRSCFQGRQSAALLVTSPLSDDEFQLRLNTLNGEEKLAIALNPETPSSVLLSLLDTKDEKFARQIRIASAHNLERRETEDPKDE
jgi:hypothetical protein